MVSRLSILFSLFVFSIIATSINAEEKEFVIDLDSTNFADTIAKHNFIVVEFYAPWCGHCKNLAPEYEKAASELSKHEPAIVLAKIDASNETNKEIAMKYEIQGFPTIKILRDGGKSIQDYSGPREADGIVKYLKKQSGPASVEIKSAQDATSLVGDKNIIVVGVFTKFSGEEYETFKAVANKLRGDYDFAHTLDARYLPRGDSYISGPIVRLFKPFDELSVDFKEFKAEAIEKFVKVSTIPLVTVYDKDPSNMPFVMKFFQSDNAKAMLFLDFNSEVSESIKSEYRKAAEQYKGQGTSFLVGDLEAGKDALEYFGLKESQAPLIIVQDNDKKYLKPNVKAEEVVSWVKDFKDGKVQEFKKSEPIPEKNDEPVKIVVAETLQDMVLNSKKNVLLEFYAPWCGHCKKLAPILDEVALSYGSDSDVLIAKLDATANDIPAGDFNVQGFPTMYFKSASGKIVVYDGDRTKEAIVEFIEKNKDKTESAKDEL